MALIDGKYYFDLTSEEQARNAELLAQYNGCVVSLGGIILPVKAISAKQPRFEIRTRSWLTGEALGKARESTTERVNRDGSITTIREKTYTESDGTRVKETYETVFDPNNEYHLINGTNPYGSLQAFYEAIGPQQNRGSHTTSISEVSPKQFPRTSTRTTRTLPPSSQTETVVVETTLADPEDLVGPTGTATRRSKTRRQVYTTNPKVFGKPIELTTITGMRFVQYIGPSTVEQDLAYWNDEMKSTVEPAPPNETDTVLSQGSADESVEEVTIDPDSNLKITHVYTTKTDPDGNQFVEATVREEPYLDPLAKLEQEFQEARQETVSTVISPLNETNETKVYDKNGNWLRTTTSSTERTPTSQTTEFTEQSSDGTTTTRTSTRELDSNGVEVITETERTERSTEVITTSRTDAVDYDQGTKTITLTKETAQADGNTRREEKVYRYILHTTVSMIEKVKEAYEDELLENIVHGRFSLEYDFSGELLENSLVQKLQTKNFEHQKAWALLELLEQQLALGDRLSIATKQKLHADSLRLFSGNNNEELRAGPVLDRIGLEVFGETFALGCVFGPQNGFNVQWIDGTERMWSWAINVQVYNQLVKDSDVLPADGWATPESLELPILPSDYLPA